MPPSRCKSATNRRTAGSKASGWRCSCFPRGASQFPDAGRSRSGCPFRQPRASAGPGSAPRSPGRGLARLARAGPRGRVAHASPARLSCPRPRRRRTASWCRARPRCRRGRSPAGPWTAPERPAWSGVHPGSPRAPAGPATRRFGPGAHPRSWRGLRGVAAAPRRDSFRPPSGSFAGRRAVPWCPGRGSTPARPPARHSARSRCASSRQRAALRGSRRSSPSGRRSPGGATRR